MDSNHINLWLGNALSLGAIVSTFMGWAPAIAAIVALIWYLLQIYESPTTQRWLANRRLRKIAALKARIVLLEAIAQPPTLPAKTDD